MSTFLKRYGLKQTPLKKLPRTGTVTEIIINQGKTEITLANIFAGKIDK